MPFFSAIGRLRWIKNWKRNPLNRCRLMNGRLIVFHFSTETSTDARDALQLLDCNYLRSVWRNFRPYTLLARVFPDGANLRKRSTNAVVAQESVRSRR